MVKVLVILAFVAAFFTAVHFIGKFVDKKKVNKSNGSGGSTPINNEEEEKLNK